MPNVLILGATGYVGRRLADALVQSGQHRVYGVARNEAKARTLALAEVTPIVCADPVNEPTAYIDAIRQHRINVVVDVAGANKDSAKFLDVAKKLGQERLLESGPRLGFVYCSGTWVHGSSDRPVSDLDPPSRTGATPPPTLVAWRISMEQSVLAASDVLDVAVVRPALIYGRESTIWTMFFLPLLQASRNASSAIVRIPLNADARPGLIHVDDVATGFKCVVEHLPTIRGSYPVFDLVTSQESMAGIFQAYATHVGYSQYALAGAGGDAFAEAMSTTMRGSADRAKQLLGWQPTRLNGFIADMDVHADAFGSQHHSGLM